MKPSNVSNGPKVARKSLTTELGPKAISKKDSTENQQVVVPGAKMQTLVSCQGS